MSGTGSGDRASFTAERTATAVDPSLRLLARDPSLSGMMLYLHNISLCDPYSVKTHCVDLENDAFAGAIDEDRLDLWTGLENCVEYTWMRKFVVQTCFYSRCFICRGSSTRSWAGLVGRRE
jgi:hypothetical protein